MNSNALRRVTEPATEPISVSDMKLHLRIDSTADDTLLPMLIAAARRYIEDITGRACITSSWEWVLDAFPASPVLELPVWPVSAITTVKYTPRGGVSTTWNSANYVLGSLVRPARLKLAYGVSWPSDELVQLEGVQIRFAAGSADAASVPDTIKHAIRLLTGHFYENREQVLTGAGISTSEIPFGVHALLVDERLVRF